MTSHEIEEQLTQPVAIYEREVQQAWYLTWKYPQMLYGVGMPLRITITPEIWMSEPESLPWILWLNAAWSPDLIIDQEKKVLKNTVSTKTHAPSVQHGICWPETEFPDKLWNLVYVKINFKSWIGEIEKKDKNKTNMSCGSCATKWNEMEAADQGKTSAGSTSSRAATVTVPTMYST